MYSLDNPSACWPEFDYTLPPGDDDAEAPYKPARQFTGHPTLDGMLIVWHGAVTPAGPPSWKDLADKIWHPWSTSLLLVECRGKAKPIRSVEAFPVATTLLGLPLFFRGDLPMDNPLTAELAEMTRQVSDARAMIPRILPARLAGDGTAVQPVVVGVPLAPVKGPFWWREVRQVLFSVVPPAQRGRAAEVKVPA
jgi:hypothetical protein